MSLLAGGIESTLKTGCSVIEMLIIDRVGRRLTLIVGAIVMSFALLVSLPKPGPYGHMSDLMLIITEDQRCAASSLPQQHQQSGRLHMCRFHFHLRARFQYGIWPCRLGLRLRGMESQQQCSHENNDLTSSPDFPHCCTRPRIKPGRQLRCRWSHHRCTNMARWHRQHRFQDLFLLHGDQLGQRAYHLFALS